MNRTRSALATLAGGVALVGGTVIAAPAAHATSQYRCTVVSAPTSVKIGTSYTVKYRYANIDTVERAAPWTTSNTNPVWSMWNTSLGRWQDVGYNNTYYRVYPGQTVTLSFTRGTSVQATGKHTFRGQMYKAVNGSTSSLMAGYSCTHAITFYR
ncbi:hypothetical protein ACOCJ4_15655 [Knoellia sp. CPCC 206435]|uniref:hypothetical protein n=1 Tax=Knoellia terrae TaxID=3404797 RepID=UPI003B4295DD